MAQLVRIGKEHHQTLRQLAKKMGVSMQTVVEKAIDELKREQFFEEFNAAYGTLKNDPEQWQKDIIERESLEGTLPDDLNPNEIWSQDGSVKSNG